jgi:hypothetical protein
MQYHVESDLIVQLADAEEAVFEDCLSNFRLRSVFIGSE